ncbi:hypothetical protein P9E76_11160 [Schinkia azotoformans]|uniref:Type IV pilus assembly protein PilO n=1 Tax=Schinkia azotoformans LMG 9581 TaxID=1131731 RepID=K6DVU8_SCHAZ|nr:hypothetical protein [Schinkia azotoformans]EKN64971.1 type IV pilus assembly protein PilO [Schinkia azotoformans LMG 9581]MEC1640253.1 hypothetical protein [Schinkia azotoformans]MEC1945602.1 hypothetical protein [Schinkia azotoformans]
MNLQLTKKNLALIFSVLFLVALVVGSYFYFLNPLKTKIKLLQDELTTEEKLYDALAQQVGDTKTGVIENSRFLQKKLPVESFLEQFLLDLEKAEVVSNSLIEDMSFQDNAVSENDVIMEDSGDQVDEQENEAANVNESEETGQQASSVPSIPEGIKRVTVNLTVTSANFFDMIKFLETIEHLERITKIDSLSFTGGKEILSIDDELEELTYTVVLSTFYYPTLAELRDELPAFDTPPPSNKDNPLPTGMYYKEDQSKAAKTDDQKSKSATSNTAGTSKNNTKSSEAQSEDQSNLEPTEKSQSIKQRAVMSGNSAE